MGICTSEAWIRDTLHSTAEQIIDLEEGDYYGLDGLDELSDKLAEVQKDISELMFHSGGYREKLRAEKHSK